MTPMKNHACTAVPLPFIVDHGIAVPLLKFEPAIDIRATMDPPGKYYLQSRFSLGGGDKCRCRSRVEGGGKVTAAAAKGNWRALFLLHASSLRKPFLTLSLSSFVQLERTRQQHRRW